MLIFSLLTVARSGNGCKRPFSFSRVSLLLFEVVTMSVNNFHVSAFKFRILYPKRVADGA